MVMMVFNGGVYDKPLSDEANMLGHNNPPEPTPIERAKEVVADLETEASAWFDGGKIESDAQADEVSRIVDAARKAKNAFEADRKAEKQPHLDAGKAVDDAWKLLTAAADRIADVAKSALTPWLLAKEKAKREAEDAARHKAEAKAEEARRLAAENDGSLAAAKARDAAIEEAEQAQAQAAIAARQKASAKGAGMGRAVGLRSRWTATITDRRALLNHAATYDPDGLTEWLQAWADAAVRNGARAVPGCLVQEEKVAA